MTWPLDSCVPLTRGRNNNKATPRFPHWNLGVACLPILPLRLLALTTTQGRAGSSKHAAHTHQYG